MSTQNGHVEHQQVMLVKLKVEAHVVVVSGRRVNEFVKELPPVTADDLPNFAENLMADLLAFECQLNADALAARLSSFLTRALLSMMRSRHAVL